MYITSNNMNHLYYELVKQVNENPDFVSNPRGMNTKESLASTFMLTNPRARLIDSKERKVNYSFAVGELIWYLSANNSLSFIKRYNSRLEQFSDDGFTLNSAYGLRIFGTNNSRENSQFQNAIIELTKDRSSRRAIVHILDKNEAFNKSKDIPCTCTLQFFIRDNKLHLHTHMRSNDVFWGVPYDVFSFTVIQEIMTDLLNCVDGFNLELGNYYHTAGSLHIYERHFKDAEKILEEYKSFDGSYTEMKPISHDDSLFLAKVEKDISIHKSIEIPSELKYSGVSWMIDMLYKKWGQPIESE
jgi:thymidylate synthase